MSLAKSVLTIVFTSFVLVNCPTSPQFETQNGKELATIGVPEFGGHLFWPADDEMFFVGGSGFYAINPSSKEINEILNSEKIPTSSLLNGRNIVYATVVLLEDKYKIYYLTDERETGFRFNRGSLYELEEGKEPQKIIANITHAKVSNDGLRVAYVRSGEKRLNDSLFVYDIESKESKYVRKALPLTFSADNNILLVDAPEEQFQLSTIDLVTGETTSLNFDNKYLYQQKELAISWNAKFPIIAFAEDREQFGEDGSALKKWDGESETIEKIWGLPEKESFSLSLPIAWSMDRSMIAKWTNRCYEGLIGNCAKRRFTLHVIQNASGLSEAVAKTAVSGASLAFSPDGSKLAYTTSNSSAGEMKLYLINTN